MNWLHLIAIYNYERKPTGMCKKFKKFSQIFDMILILTMIKMVRKKRKQLNYHYNLHLKINKNSIVLAQSILHIAQHFWYLTGLFILTY